VQTPAAPRTALGLCRGSFSDVNGMQEKKKLTVLESFE
jgi:hypothetical protein